MATARRRSRIVWTVLLVLWICVVWGHSLMSAEISAEESSRFVFLVRPFFAMCGITDEGFMTHVIRKTAHFSEYAVLASIAIGCVRAWWGATRTALYTVLAIWVCVPVVDETIQGLSPGRAPRVTDVLIDMAGGLLGMLIAHAVLRRKRLRN